MYIYNVASQKIVNIIFLKTNLLLKENNIFTLNILTLIYFIVTPFTQ